MFCTKHAQLATINVWGLEKNKRISSTQKYTHIYIYIDTYTYTANYKHCQKACGSKNIDVW